MDEFPDLRNVVSLKKAAEKRKGSEGSIGTAARNILEHLPKYSIDPLQQAERDFSEALGSLREQQQRVLGGIEGAGADPSSVLEQEILSLHERALELRKQAELSRIPTDRLDDLIEEVNKTAFEKFGRTIAPSAPESTNE